MDRNTFTGLILIFIIIAGSVFLMKPSQDELNKERALQDSLARVKKGEHVLPKDTKTAISDSTKLAPVDSAVLKSPFGSAHFGNEQLVTLENEFIKATLTSKGGRVKSVEIKNEKTFRGKSLILFDGDANRFGLLFPAAGVNINTNDLYFTSNGGNASVSKADSASVSFRLPYADGRYIDYIYSLKGESHQIGFTIVTKGMQDVVAPAEKTITINWEASLPLKEQSMSSERQYSTAYYRNNEGDVKSLSIGGNDDKELPANTQWVSFKQHFFSSVLIAPKGFFGGKLAVTTPVSDQIVKNFAANISLEFPRQDISTYPMHFYFGPNQYRVLKSQGYELQDQVNLGWGPMHWVNRWVTIPAFNLLDSLNIGYGLVILILTLLLKLLLSPLTYRSYKSMAKMRVLKPEMDQIKAKVGEDNPTLLQQEYLKLYKQAGVNPLGGCIPMLLQMPFTIAFFSFFPNLYELRGESFLWAKDLSTYDTILNFPPIFGVDHVSLFCILMTIATLVSTWYNNSISGATGQMKYIGYFMPLIFLFVLNSYPAGLNYYYFLSTCMTFVQQFIIRQMINDDKIHAAIQANKKKPEGEKKKSKFQSRMEDYMRQQQAKPKK
ncbi:YidC/Oxa1 family membrane protein insertase [bacterium A37T11]|nr:YidC/Oxa1 family membrane protein insertase [bacterium A37T11]